MPAQPETAAWRRYALLCRHPDLDLAQFSRHYERHHGPLAASLPGFRKFTWRYVQNHVEPLPDGTEPRFHGVSMSSQVPRADLRRGFFDEPDYQKIKPDELYLFDMRRTISVLGTEGKPRGGPATRWKALLLSTTGLPSDCALPGLMRRVRNQLDTASASALGFGASNFAFDNLFELWFETEAARDAAFRNVSAGGNDVSLPFLLPVREVMVLGPDHP